MVKRLLRHKPAVITLGIILFISLIGILAPVIAPNDPYKVDLINKFASPSFEMPQQSSAVHLPVSFPLAHPQ
ncbi:MAG: hypothetical protein ATN32_09940 [Candidatus Epulonipiscium fishelsonii]|nr:MAG: hypothetical protein ATN32_09940 [Epulopiscium sp. AS2M-Bin002]